MEANLENRYFDLYNKAPVGYITVSATGELIESNETAKMMLGFGLNGIKGLNIKDSILKSDFPKYERAIKQTIASSKVLTTELRMTKTNKRTVWVQMTLVKECTEKNYGTCRIILIDITARRHLALAILTKNELLETTLSAAGDGVISTDKRGNVVFMNTVAEVLTGWTQELAINQPVTLIFNIINEKTRANRSNIIKRAFDSEVTKKISTTTLLISKDGKERSIEASVAPIILQSGETVGVVVVMQDWTNKKKKEEQTLFQSNHDHLTGLYNRRFYEAHLLKIDTKSNFPIALIMGDVNGLKVINDSYGHAAGDELLKIVAVNLQESCRDDDVVARIGGDEFMIILPKTDTKEAERIIKHIKSLCKDKTVESKPVSVSFGYAIKRSEDEHIGDISKQAEDKMYLKKKQGGMGRPAFKELQSI